jgi:hypothetical protein
VAGEKNSRQLCVAHFAYAPLIFELSVAHFAICATNRSNMRGAYSQCAIDKTEYLSTTLLVGPTWILVAHSEQYAPLVRKLSVEHICKCTTSKY